MFCLEKVLEEQISRGNYDTLIKSIKKELLTLPEVIIYNGHGPATTIGHEKKYNSFLR